MVAADATGKGLFTNNIDHLAKFKSSKGAHHFMDALVAANREPRTPPSTDLQNKRPASAGIRTEPAYSSNANSKMRRPVSAGPRQDNTLADMSMPKKQATFRKASNTENLDVLGVGGQTPQARPLQEVRTPDAPKPQQRFRRIAPISYVAQSGCDDPEDIFTPTESVEEPGTPPQQSPPAQSTTPTLNAADLFASLNRSAAAASTPPKQGNAKTPTPPKLSDADMSARPRPSSAHVSRPKQTVQISEPPRQSHPFLQPKRSASGVVASRRTRRARTPDLVKPRRYRRQQSISISFKEKKPKAEPRRWLSLFDKFKNEIPNSDKNETMDLSTAVALLTRSGLLNCQRVGPEMLKEFLVSITCKGEAVRSIATVEGSTTGTLTFAQFIGVLHWVAKAKGITYSECVSRFMDGTGNMIDAEQSLSSLWKDNCQRSGRMTSHQLLRILQSDTILAKNRFTATDLYLWFSKQGVKSSFDFACFKRMIPFLAGKFGMQEGEFVRRLVCIAPPDSGNSARQRKQEPALLKPNVRAQKSVGGSSCASDTDYDYSDVADSD